MRAKGLTQAWARARTPRVTPSVGRVRPFSLVSSARPRSLAFIRQCGIKPFVFFVAELLWRIGSKRLSPLSARMSPVRGLIDPDKRALVQASVL